MGFYYDECRNQIMRNIIVDFFDTDDSYWNTNRYFSLIEHPEKITDQEYQELVKLVFMKYPNITLNGEICTQHHRHPRAEWCPQYQWVYVDISRIPGKMIEEIFEELCNRNGMFCSIRELNRRGSEKVSREFYDTLIKKCCTGVGKGYLLEDDIDYSNTTYTKQNIIDMQINCC